MRYSIIWDVTQRRLVDSYRRFETTFRPQINGEAVQADSRQPLGTQFVGMVLGVMMG